MKETSQVLSRLSNLKARKLQRNFTLVLNIKLPNQFVIKVLIQI